MAGCLISLGTNLGERVENIQKAASRIQQAFGAERVRFSSIYQTPPVGGPGGQDYFLNAIAAIDSEFDVYSVWAELRRIEKDLGRTRQLRWEARKLDLDVVLFGSERIWSPRFKVPHPRMCMRSFVLQPASEVVPHWVDPITQRSMQSLLDGLSDRPIRLAVVCETAMQLRQIMQTLIESPGLQRASISRTAENQVRIGDWAVVEMIALEPKFVRSESFLWRKTQAVTSWKEKIPYFLENFSPQLLMLAASSSDDPAVAWEDATRDWANAMGIAPAPQNLASLASIPRYLLIADDPAWASHEIEAALNGMTCSLERTSLLI